MSPWFDYLLSSRGELRSMLEGSPWRLHRTIDSEGSPYVAVIEKG
jgi:hypothetical protein